MVKLSVDEVQALQSAINTLDNDGRQWKANLLRGIIERIQKQSQVDEDGKLLPYAVRHPADVVLESSAQAIDDCLTLFWSVKNVGFGQFNFKTDKEGKVEIWNECMGAEFIKHVLNHLVDNAKLMEN